MAYASVDFKSKKALKEAVAAGQAITVFSTGLGRSTYDGETSLEGPHYPKPHTWYARVRVENGVVTKVLS